MCSAESCRLQHIHIALMKNTMQNHSSQAPDKAGGDDPGSALIDQQVLDDLMQLKGADNTPILPALLDMYFDNSATLLAEINQHLTDSDTGKLMSAAHSLKSVSLSTGGSRLGSLCGAMEKAAREGNLQEAKRIFARLEPLHRDTVAALQTCLDMHRQHG